MKVSQAYSSRKAGYSLGSDLILGGTHYNGLNSEAPPKRGTFFRLQLYERVGMSLVGVYERVRKSVISGSKTGPRAKRYILRLFIFKRQCIYRS